MKTNAKIAKESLHFHYGRFAIIDLDIKKGCNGNSRSSPLAF